MTAVSIVFLLWLLASAYLWRELREAHPLVAMIIIVIIAGAIPLTNWIADKVRSGE
jgi:4-amino-4-deoxy-L-arabinose transferase-like glycosyltransferase